MRLAAYAGASVVLATGVLLKALHQRSNFYSACVYLSQSSANLMILTNLCLLITGFLLFWLQRLLYGPLRPIETEQLYERAWFAVTETCLAMTIFRGELGAWFLVMFISLLVGKVWGWIGEGRVEFLEQQPPANPKLFHIRLASSLALTVLFDCFMLRYCVHTVITQARPDMMVMFGFEFAILTILSSSTLLRYAIALTEISITRQQVKARVEERRAEIRVARVEAIQESARAGASSPPADLPDENDVNELEIDVPGWEEKGRWVFYLDLLTDLLKLVIYLTFFGILLTFYGLPIHILRDVVVTIRSFARRIVDFMRYRNATRDMNQRYPDATVEEVSREDVCIICREEMTPVQPAQPAQPAEGAAEHPAAPPAAGSRHVPERLRPKKLPCGHILHFACLRSWLERQQNCPTCRRPVIAPNRTAGAAGVGGNNAPGQPNGNQAGQPGANGAPRARVLQLGPLRVAFGAMRGDLFNNMHHRQIPQGNAQQPAANPPADAPAGQIGFGLGFGQRPQAPAPTPPHATGTGGSTASDLSAQLLQIEQRLTHEIQTLRAATEQLTRVRNLQLELDRLRQQGAPGTNPVQSSHNPLSAPTPGPNPSVFSARQFVGASSNSVMNSGDARLPEGLTIPPGWTLLPLQRMDNSTGLAQPVPPVPATSVTTETSPALASNSAVPLSDTTSAPHQANGDGAVAQAIPEPSTSSTKIDSTLQPTPTVPAPAPDTRADEVRADSPSQEWTDLAPKQPLATGSTIPTTWGSGESSQAPASPDERSESPSKGKGRAVTVEETADEEAV